MAGKKKKPSERKYSPKAQETVREALHEMKEGKLESGRSHKKVKSREQAIAIGISEARKKHEKTPPPLKKSKSSSKTKKRSTKKSSTKKASSSKKRKTTGRKKTTSRAKKK